MRYADIVTKATAHADPKGTVNLANARQVSVNNQGDFVILFLDGNPLPMRTPTAVKLYLELGHAAGEIDAAHYADAASLETGVVVATIERESVPMWPEFARKLAGALMRHADQVDDRQLANPRRVLQ